MVFCATCNKHLVRNMKKAGVNNGILLSDAAATAPRRKPLHRDATTAATAWSETVAAELAWRPAVAAAAAAAAAQQCRRRNPPSPCCLAPPPHLHCPSLFCCQLIVVQSASSTL